LNDSRPTILITGISGNLGVRLLPRLSEYRIIGVDLSLVPGRPDIELYPLDLGRESSCVKLVQVLRETNAEAVVHLAFVTEPLRTAVIDREHIWQINVAGTARVMEAISEVNRNGGNVRKFIYPSSVAVYGAETNQTTNEDTPLSARPLKQANHKTETDGVVRMRAGSMGKCNTYLLRSPTYAGATVESYLLNAIRGHALAIGNMEKKTRSRQKPLLSYLPAGEWSPQKLVQFLHVDDMARLITWLLRRTAPDESELLTLNVAGSGSPLSISQCAEIAQMRIRQLPSKWVCTKITTMLCNRGVLSVPPDALSYLTGSQTTSTQKLRELLGSDYEKVIQYSTEAALRDSFAKTEAAEAACGN